MKKEQQSDSDVGAIKIRYTDDEYVRRFFESGELMLSTYQRCREHDDLARRDALEGRGNFFFTNGRQAMAGVSCVGDSSYMFCTSMKEDAGLQRKFKTNSYFKIHDVAGFAAAVASRLQSVVAVLHGACIYVAGREVSRPVTQVNPDFQRLLQAVRENGDVQAAFYDCQREQSTLLQSHLGSAPFFLKEKEPFAEEAEYRFVWTMNHPVGKPLFIYCPDAVKFCSREQEITL